MATAKCCVGEYVNELCFSEKYVKHSNYLLLGVESIDSEDVKTILYRANMFHLSKVCLHHLQAFTTQFHLYKKRSLCSYPFEIHKTNSKFPKGTKSATMKMCDAIKEIQSDLHVYPGQKLCPNCYMTFLNVNVNKIPWNPPRSALPKFNDSSELDDCEIELNNISYENDTSFDSPSKPLSRSLTVTSALEVTPVILDKKRSKTQRYQVIKRKASQVQEAFLKLHEPIANIVDEVLEITSNDTTNSVSPNDCEVLMYELKQRCETLKKIRDYKGILSLLTLAPVSWTQQRTSHFFDVSISQVKISRILKKEKGILAIPDNKKGRKLSPEEEEIVKDFYLSDENSRVQPGMNDYVSVRIKPGEKKVKVQKQLLLMNIDELYYKYKKYCTEKLCMKSCGRSKFFALRPVNVIEVGASGFHNVCVC